jgi:effector-binding domain-containing protein
MIYTCELIEQDPKDVLSIRTHCPVSELPQTLGKAYDAVMAYLAELGEQPGGAPFVGYFNMDMQNLDIEAGFPVARPLLGKGEIQPGTLPGGKVVSCLYTGPYSQIEPAYNALMAWFPANDCQPTGVAYEFYLNDPENTPEAELQTLITMPVK